LLKLGLVVAALAMALSALFVALVRRYAPSAMMDIPNERSSHSLPTPSGGGIAIVVSSFLVLGGLVLFHYIGIPRAILIGFGLGAGLIAALGLVDDIFHLDYRIRLVFQLVGATLILVSIGSFGIISVPFVGHLEQGIFSAILTLLWIMGLTNSFNFMDGIDAIAGGQALTAAAAWAIIGFGAGHPEIGLVAIVLAASCLGFLFYNLPPASIFMGDVGSLFLGFSFSSLPIITHRLFPDPFRVRLPIASVLLLSPFILDSAFTLMARVFRKQRLSLAHRSHLYQRLVISGLSHGKVALLYSALGLLGALVGLFYIFSNDRKLADVAAISGVLIVLLAPMIWVLHRERPTRRGNSTQLSDNRGD